MMEPKHRAVLQTLLTSAKTNLNATLTAEDAKIVLSLIRTGIYQTNPVGQIFRSATEVIETLADELDRFRNVLDPGGPPSERKD